MSLHPGVLALHEPVPHLATEGYLKWSGRGEADYFRYKLYHKRGKNLQQIDANKLVYFESSLYLAHFVEELHEMYGARFIHLYRDGRQFTRSALSKGWYTGRTFEQRAKAILRHNLHIETGNWWHDTRLSPPDSMSSRFEKCAWLWCEINGVILRSMERVEASAKMSVRLEDFDRSTIEQIYDFIGIEVIPDVLDAMERVAARRPNKSRTDGSQQPYEWTEAQSLRFNEIAGPMMSRLGYAD